MIIGFTGTRYGMTDKQWYAVLGTLKKYQVSEVHHGDCVGADEEFHNMVISLDIRTVIHPPIIHTLRAYCQGDIVLPAKQYSERNLAIVLASDLVIAAPPTEQEMPEGGTWQTIRYTREHNKPCKVVLPSGIVVDA